jgi:protein tyrosine/serine phosphatase
VSNSYFWIISALLVALVLSACAHRPFFENLHRVLPGELYRSAQLPPDRLEAVIGENGIKSVLNLRGASPGEDWYEGELAASKKAGAEHFDLELSSKVELTAARSQEVLDLMQKVPKPLLVHCWGGADRTGLATALYLYAVRGEQPEQASRALSLRYYHLSMTSAGAMDKSFQRFVDSKSAVGLPAPAK